MNADGERQRGLAPDLGEQECLLSTREQEHEHETEHVSAHAQPNLKLVLDATDGDEAKQTQDVAHTDATSHAEMRPVAITQEEHTHEQKQKVEEQKQEERKEAQAAAPNSVPDATGIAMGYVQQSSNCTCT